MSSKNHRSGGKFGGGHTTFIELALPLVDEASTYSEVTKISSGFIINDGHSASDTRRVKFTDHSGSLLLKVRSKIASQEVRVYSKNIQETRTKLARFARSQRMIIGFGEDVSKRPNTTTTS